MCDEVKESVVVDIYGLSTIEVASIISGVELPVLRRNTFSHFTPIQLVLREAKEWRF